MLIWVILRLTGNSYTYIYKCSYHTTMITAFVIIIYNYLFCSSNSFFSLAISASFSSNCESFFSNCVLFSSSCVSFASNCVLFFSNCALFSSACAFKTGTSGGQASSSQSPAFHCTVFCHNRIPSPRYALS